MKATKQLCALLMLYVVLGSWKGYLAIFEKNEDEPRQIFPTLVSTLPPTDQKALEEGIIVRNQRDLEQLIEDYTS